MSVRQLKKAWITVLCLFAFVLTVPSSPAIAEQPNSFSHESDGITVTITQVVYKDDPVEIPPMIDDKPVTRIGPEAFANLGVKDVNIPEGVISIGSEAFRNCASLMEIRIPSTVQVIEERAFAECRLASVYFMGPFPDIDDTAFQECPPNLTFYFREDQGAFPPHIQGYTTIIVAADQDNRTFPVSGRNWLILLGVMFIIIVSIFMPMLGFVLKKDLQARKNYRQMLILMIAGLLTFGLTGLTRHLLRLLPTPSGFPWRQILAFVFVFVLQAMLSSLIFSRLTRPALSRARIMRACLTGIPAGLLAAVLMIAPFFIVLFIFFGLAVSVPWWVSALYDLIMLMCGTAAGTVTGLMTGHQLGLKKHIRKLTIAFGLAGILTMLLIRAIVWTKLLLQDGSGSESDLYLSWSIMDMLLGCGLGLAIALAVQEAGEASESPKSKEQPPLTSEWRHP